MAEEWYLYFDNTVFEGDASPPAAIWTGAGWQLGAADGSDWLTGDYYATLTALDGAFDDPAKRPVKVRYVFDGSPTVLRASVHGSIGWDAAHMDLLSGTVSEFDLDYYYSDETIARIRFYCYSKAAQPKLIGIYFYGEPPAGGGEEPVAEIFDASDTILDVNQFRAVLTGDGDGLGDLDLKISSLNFRVFLTDDGKRKTIIDIVTPEWGKGHDVASRMNGDIVVYWIYRYVNGIPLEREMGRAAFNSVSLYEGADSRSVNMGGESEVTADDVFGTVDLDHVSYRSEAESGKKQWRGATVFGADDLMPGHTVRYSGESFVLREYQIIASPDRATVVHFKE